MVVPIGEQGEGEGAPAPSATGATTASQLSSPGSNISQVAAMNGSSRAAFPSASDDTTAAKASVKQVSNRKLVSVRDTADYVLVFDLYLRQGRVGPS